MEQTQLYDLVQTMVIPLLAPLILLIPAQAAKMKAQTTTLETARHGRSSGSDATGAALWKSTGILMTVLKVNASKVSIDDAKDGTTNTILISENLRRQHLGYARIPCWFCKGTDTLTGMM